MSSTNWTKPSSVSTSFTRQTVNSTNWGPDDASFGAILQEDVAYLLTEDSLFNIGQE